MYKIYLAIAVIFFFVSACHAKRLPSNSTEADAPTQFIILNSTSLDANATKIVKEIASTFGKASGKRIAVGVAYIISYLDVTPAKADSTLRKVLALSQQYDLPILVHLDGENEWGNRPDLWNWWDSTKSGYNPENRYNVEWHDWSPDSATKIGWRNWGQQVRTPLPMPNLMSPVYREACDSAMQRLVPIVTDWWHSLPDSLKYLFVGINVGWESGIGVNNWYYPNGNAVLDQPEANDPTYGLNLRDLPSRGVQAIGYAAVSTLGLAHSGKLTEEQLAKVTQIHLEDLSKVCYDLGVPRDHIFTHCGGWCDGDPTFYAAVNKYSCPGWSFYKHAYDPAENVDPMNALKSSDAPYWAATEWLYMGDHGDGETAWLLALENTLSIPRIRYLCIYNWEGIINNQAAIEAIRVGSKFR